MKVVVIAIGQKLPDWANTACEDYLRRFPKDWNVEVKALKAEDRNTKTTEKIMQAEAERIRSAIPKNSVLVILDERGVDLTSVKLASKLNSWNDQGRTVVFVIGGARGRADASFIFAYPSPCDGSRFDIGTDLPFLVSAAQPSVSPSLKCIIPLNFILPQNRREEENFFLSGD